MKGGVKARGDSSMLADWLAILHKKPAGTPLPWQRNEETFVLNGHPERPGSKFKPEWIYSYRPPLSERWLRHFCTRQVLGTRPGPLGTLF